MTPLPSSFDVTGLRRAGFEGFESVVTLRDTHLAVVPRKPGVYAVVRDKQLRPRFLTKSTAGWFKGLDPSYPTNVVKSNWVEGATVVYLGKAGSEVGSATLRSRLTQLLRFGDGKSVGHRGGRLLWHLADSEDLLVCWRRSADPRDEEMRLLAEFQRQYGRLPFANMIL